MHLKYQRGLSLLWTAAVMGLLAFVAMAGLLSMKQERNILAESWKRITGSAAAQALQQGADKLGNTGGALRSVPGTASDAASRASTAGSIRKCVINGKVVYSDSECGTRGSPARLHDTQGFESPKNAPAPEAENDASFRDKMIDRAVQNQERAIK